MSDLTPITRNEHLLNGDDLEPKNRKEMFLKRIYDKTQSVPEPETREEYFLKKAGDASGDITIEQLNVTESGTYAEQGKAYSPVVVNVPSYLVKDVPNLPQAVASFDDAIVAPIIKLKADIEAVQDLHGYDAPWVGGGGKNKFDISMSHEAVTGGSYLYDVTVKPNTSYTMSSNCPLGTTASLYFNGTSSISNGVGLNNPKTATSDSNGLLKVYVRYNPSGDGIDLYTAVQNGTYYIQLEEGSTDTSYAPYSNICPISGWDGANVTVCDDVDNPTVENVVNIAFTDGTNPLTVYGGTLDVTSGLLTVTCSTKLDLGNIPWASITSSGTIRTDSQTLYKFKGSVICDNYTEYTGGLYELPDNSIGVTNSQANPFIRLRDTTNLSGKTIDEAKTFLSGKYAVIELDTPQTYQLTPTEVKSLLGVNNIFADCGDVTECRYITEII